MITIDELKVQSDKKSRLLGVDMGTKRIGISICDENRKIATPLETIEFININPEKAKEQNRIYLFLNLNCNFTEKILFFL